MKQNKIDKTTKKKKKEISKDIYINTYKCAMYFYTPPILPFFISFKACMLSVF